MDKHISGDHPTRSHINCHCHFYSLIETIFTPIDLSGEGLKPMLPQEKALLSVPVITKITKQIHAGLCSQQLNCPLVQLI